MLSTAYERLIGKDWTGPSGKEYILNRKIKGGMSYDVRT
ncbi:hypothetical protein BSI_26200 [Bacillus inaquosorum KCTC 13429]|uniref:Uncharacterized protein n=1 Tax=Bacillus inaquosorum KCTC 13429 TaxID=1236548 RepID=A0A9W5PCU7_9BACI|nr:hypothetical protein BSI_26200 [Bacillus inaquosorum KCTC 13429]